MYAASLNDDDIFISDTRRMQLLQNGREKKVVLRGTVVTVHSDGDPMIGACFGCGATPLCDECFDRSKYCWWCEEEEEVVD